MAFSNIRNAISDRLGTIDSIQEVREYPTEIFDGYPAAVVKSIRNDSEFQSTIENKRAYVFTVFLVQEIEITGMRKARRIIEGVVDDVIDSFDQDQLLSGVSLPDNESMLIVRPALSEIWEDPKYMVAELEISVMVQFNIAT